MTFSDTSGGQLQIGKCRIFTTASDPKIGPFMDRKASLSKYDISE
jgi:hypothetical protein